MAVASSDEIGVPTFDEHACSILCNAHSLHVDDIEFLRSPSVMQSIEPELRITLLSDLDSRENIIAALRRGVRGYLLTSPSLKITSGECDGPASELRVWHLMADTALRHLIAPARPASSFGRTPNGPQRCRMVIAVFAFAHARIRCDAFSCDAFFFSLFEVE